MLKHIFCSKNSEYRFILLFWSVLQNTWSKRHMTEFFWLRHKLVLSSFYSHQQLMNSMVKIPRQFKTILDVGLQGLCPWTLLASVYSEFPGPLLYSLHHSLCSSKVNRKSLRSYCHPNSILTLYVFDLKLLLWAYILYILQVKSSNKLKIKHNDILKISEIF